MSHGPFLAVDWGTTNCRAWVVDEDGRPGSRHDFPLGVAGLAPGEAARRFHGELRPAMDAKMLPALMAGMIGSTLGWLEAPYAEAPADAASLAAGVLRIAGEAPSAAIVPGVRAVREDGAPDVMRGEETQIVGWLAGAAERRSGERLVYHPGTHGKWVRVQDGRIARFVTVMTGELFALLTGGGVLRSEAPPAGAAPDWAAFDLGLAQANEGGDLIAQLFTARSRVVAGDLALGSQRDYLSGLLVGADVGSAPALLGAAPDEPVALIGEPALCTRFARALDRAERPYEIVDGEAAFLAGLSALARAGALEAAP